MGRSKRMLKERLQRFGNGLLSALAGAASFVFTLMALLVLREIDEKVLAAITMGSFALLITWIASERPNSGQARAIKAVIERLLAVRRGDLSSPTPKIVHKQLPALATAVDALFEQVRSNLDDARAMAMYDPVTALPNRVYFKREGEALLEARQPADRAAVLFIDLDGFKEVNDTFGHAQGDVVLASVANRLRLLVKEQAEPGRLSQPIIARLAGDEFTLLFPTVISTEEARAIAERVLGELSEPFAVGGQSVAIGASIGVALCPDHGTDLTTLMKAADIAMYHAKASGRSQVCVYNRELASAFDEKVETERALREALAADQFTLAYQPQLCARTGSPLAAEALLRWNHPTKGVLLPGSFIPIAEESTLINAIGDWVIQAIVDALGRWKAAGLTQRLTFNVSPRQLELPGFLARLREQIETTGSPPWLLELEFTETMAMQCSDAVLAELAALRADGVSIAIDDFGSGYSNLSRMKDMPIDRVKLDQSLTADVDASENARTIIAAVIHLIHGLGLEVVGEGIERKEQIEVLRAVGCDTFQGHALAEAMTETEFFAWLAAKEQEAKTA